MEYHGAKPESKPRVVIAGGGVGGLEAMLALADLAGDRIEVDLYAPSQKFLYRPLAVTEPFGLHTILSFDLGALTALSGASFHLDSIASVDPQQRRITTRDGLGLDFDYLVIACGTRMIAAIPGAVTFWGVVDELGATAVLGELEAGALQSLIFALPSRSAWPLAAYELALIAASRLRGVAGPAPTLTIVTPEGTPLGSFGVRASEQMGEFLERRGISVVTGAHPVKFEGGRLQIAPGDPIEADAVISLPGLQGRLIAGVPNDRDGFIPVDPHGKVVGIERVFAVGDVTNFPVKQGGIATQQADAAAQMIASELGAEVEPLPFEPILRAKLFTGEQPQYLFGRLTGGHGDTSTFSDAAPWSEEGKIIGRYLAPFLSAASNRDRGAPSQPPGSPLAS